MKLLYIVGPELRNLALKNAFLSPITAGKYVVKCCLSKAFMCNTNFLLCLRCICSLFTLTVSSAYLCMDQICSDYFTPESFSRHLCKASFVSHLSIPAITRSQSRFPPSAKMEFLLQLLLAVAKSSL